MAEPTQKAKLIKIRDLTPSVREIILLPLEFKISFTPGQWISLNLPVGERPPLVRAYSMAEPEASSGELVLAFDRVPGGLGSGYLLSLKVGDEVVMSGPYGHFVSDDRTDRDLLLVARFTGIVPMRCILKHLYARPHPPKSTLIYGMPSRAEQIYHTEFMELARSHESFRYVPTYLDSGNKTMEESRSERDIIASLWASLWQGEKNFFPMVCGTKAFVRPMRAYLKELGFDRKEMKFETYD